MKKIIYTNSDGSLAVVHPIRNTIGETLTMDAEIEQRAWDALPKDAINPVFVDESVILEDRTFRDSWEHGGNSIIVNIEKAKFEAPVAEPVTETDGIPDQYTWNESTVSWDKIINPTYNPLIKE